jgi:Ca2+-binding RTX toxin-like protein
MIMAIDESIAYLFSVLKIDPFPREFTGSDRGDRINGTTNSDYMLGLNGADTLNGLGGNDYLEGGAGIDTIDGGAGTDTVGYVNAPSAVTVLLPLLDVVGASLGGDGADVLRNIDNAVGSSFNDTITGNDGANVLAGLHGNDVLYGGAGNDTLIGGIGDDRLFGGDGNDSLRDDENPDDPYSTDVLDGGAGDDEFVGGLGPNIMIGGAGADTFWSGYDNAGTTFKFQAVSDFASLDVIDGFNFNDKIDLSAINAPGDGDAFHIGEGPGGILIESDGPTTYLRFVGSDGRELPGGINIRPQFDQELEESNFIL